MFLTHCSSHSEVVLHLDSENRGQICVHRLKDGQIDK